VNGDTRIEVLDVTGRIALTKALGRTLHGANQDAVNVSQLAPGAYQVRLMVDGRTVHQTALQRAE